MAIKYYAGNKITGVASDTKPTSNIIDGSTFFVTDTEDLFMYDLGTTSWKIVSGNTIAETLSNKTFSDIVTVAEGSYSGTPAGGYGALYIKSSDSKIYFKNDGGTEFNLTEGQSEGGEANQNAFATVAVSGQSSVVADGETDTLTFVAGSGMTITTAAGSDTVTFAASGGGTLTVTDNESTNENNLLTFVADAGTNTGAHALEMDGDFHYNPSTGRLTATQLAGTLQTAAQTNITSVGVLDGGSITSNFGNINVGSSTITTTGTITAGDVVINGTSTTINSTTVTVNDPLFALADNNAADSVDIGWYGKYVDSGTKYSGLFRDSSDSDKWKVFATTGNSHAAPTTTVDTSSGFTLGVLAATTFEGALSGNATTATALATGRTIAASGDITWTSASFTGAGNVTGVAAITADVIINADVKTDAAIAYSKLAALADGNILVGNGSNVATSVNPSGDIDVTNAGVFSIASDVVVNADIKSDAAIVDTKLATISTADKVAGGAIQIDSGTDGTGITIAATDKFLIDDGGTTKYVNASQVLTYTSGSGASESFAIAMAVAL